MARFARTTAVMRRPSKRHVGWDLAVVADGYVDVAAGAKAVLATVTVAGLVSVGPGTVVRSRGFISTRTDQNAASEDQIGAFGIGFVNSVAGTLGITALPGPVTEALWDGWFVHQFFADRFTRGDTTGFTSRTQTLEIDSKAMRKFDQDQNMVLMVENGGLNGLAINIQMRFLIKAG